MAVSPINFSRVTHNLQTLSLLDSLRRNTMELFAQQNRLASGLRLNSPSDDPVLASQALNLSQVLESQDQVLLNTRFAGAFLGATDNAMSDVTDLVTQAKTIAGEMVNSYVRPDEREAQAAIVKSIVEQLIDVGNTLYNGVYLFGGKKTTSPPFVSQLGGVMYTGDTTDITIDIGTAQDAVVNLTGDALFGMTTGRVAGYRNLAPAPLPDTRLSDLGGATSLGIRPGKVQVLVNGGATAFTVDLQGASTLGNVVDAINHAWNEAGGAGALASIEGTGLRLDTGGAGSIEVRESGNGSIASDLGILGTGAIGILSGGDLHARIISTTPMTALAGGAGVSLSGPIQITNGTTSKTIDLSGARTVQDILNAINTVGVGVKAVINDSATGIDVVNLVSGPAMRISELGGTTADSLGILTLHTGGLLADLNNGRGVSSIAGKSDFRVHSLDGTSFEVSLAGATTVQDVLDRINAAAAAAGAQVTAALNPNGPGIRLDDASGGAGTLAIERLNMSAAIDDLGLNKSAPAGQSYLISDDVAGVRVNSAFTALSDLEAALQQDDTAAINRAAQKLEQILPNLIRIRGIVGARSKAMTDRVTFTEDAVESTKKLLSEVKDLDYTEAVTKFQQAQTALQANLMTGSRMLTISLLDYLA